MIWTPIICFGIKSDRKRRMFPLESRTGLSFRVCSTEILAKINVSPKCEFWSPLMQFIWAVDFQQPYNLRCCWEIVLAHCSWFLVWLNKSVRCACFFFLFVVIWFSWILRTRKMVDGRKKKRNTTSWSHACDIEIQFWSFSMKNSLRFDLAIFVNNISECERLGRGMAKVQSSLD